MNKHTTTRGFAYYEFKDSGGNKCTLQKSSAIENKIWLGCSDIGLQGFIPCGDPSWIDITEKEIKEKFQVNSLVSNVRMHLSQETAKELIPILQRFVDTGEI